MIWAFIFEYHWLIKLSWKTLLLLLCEPRSRGRVWENEMAPMHLRCNWFGRGGPQAMTLFICQRMKGRGPGIILLAFVKYPSLPLVSAPLKFQLQLMKYDRGLYFCLKLSEWLIQFVNCNDVIVSPSLTSQRFPNAGLRPWSWSWHHLQIAPSLLIAHQPYVITQIPPWSRCY